MAAQLTDALWLPRDESPATNPQVWAMTDLKQQDATEETKVPTNATDGAGPVTTRRAARAEIVVPTPPPPAPIQRPPSPEEVVDSLRFMFAVGIECSYPIVAGERAGRPAARPPGTTTTGRPTSASCEASACATCATARRSTASSRAAASTTGALLDQVMAEMRKLGIVPIIDLVHFGLPDWLGNFQNPEWPYHFAEYARAFAERYPWVRFYTPVNEIYVTAQFRAAFGWWNERLMSDEAFVTNLKHCVKAAMLAMRAILELRADAIFIFSESHRVRAPRQPEHGAAGALHERAAIPLARPALRPRRLGDDVPLPARQRHDDRGVPLVPRAGATCGRTASWGPIITSPTST